MRSRSAPGASGFSIHSIISHDTIVKNRSDTVYTFSFTTDWFHTVNAVAPMRVARPATTMRCQRSPIQRATILSVMRNQKPAEHALANAARILILAAYETGIGSDPNA